MQRRSDGSRPGRASQDALPSAPPPEEPWHFGPEPVYKMHADHSQALRGATHAPFHANEGNKEWHEHRKQVLLEWGKKREEEMHRPPLWCMDQLCSGSNLFPPRHLHDDWFAEEELQMIAKLEQLLQPTGHAAFLARDMMALRMYDVDIRIIADDSGSMASAMIGGSDGGWGWGSTGWTPDRIQKVFGRRAFRPESRAAFADNPFNPTDSRWQMLQDHLGRWEEVFQILKVQRTVYLLNDCGGTPNSTDNMDSILRYGPRGGTPMGATFQRVLADYQRTGRPQGRPLLLLALTDGEANDGYLFNAVLDEIQDGLHGDVQVLLMGLSLEPEDIEWFEDEECDDTRIRTIEAYEVEQQLILFRKVIQRSGDYNFAMHVYRGLVTNFFPADYDYEAPLQTLRHRLYITLHALDRRFTGRRDAQYASAIGTGFNPAGALVCAPCFLGAVAYGHPLLACLSGIGACVVGAATGKRNTQGGANRDFEEGLGEADDQLIGALVRRLQGQSLSGREPLPFRANVSWGRRLPYCDYNTLGKLQRAIGTLSPSEQSMRDYQFMDIEYNKKALQVTIALLREVEAAAR